jgi:hypothetical protein
MAALRPFHPTNGKTYYDRLGSSASVWQPLDQVRSTPMTGPIRRRVKGASRYVGRYATPLAIGALSGRPPFAASGTACTRRVAGDAKATGCPAGQKNLVRHAWRKKPKCWRAITRTPFDFSVSVSAILGGGRQVLWLRIVGGPGCH